MWLYFSGASASIMKNPGYYDQIKKSYNDFTEPFRKDILKDVDRTYLAKIDEIHHKKVMEVLVAYTKRNSIVGYCQGLNTIISYFIEIGFTEEESFWLLANIIENFLPSEFYTNLFPIVSDCLILDLMIKQNQPRLSKHFKQIEYFDLNIPIIPYWIMLFTLQKNSRVREIVLDHFFLQGPIVLIKAMYIAIKMNEAEFLKHNEQSSILATFQNMFNGSFDVDKFQKEMWNFYLSRSVIYDLRTRFTDIQYNSKNQDGVKKDLKKLECDKNWPICYQTLIKNSGESQNLTYTLQKTSSILDNYKPGHFSCENWEIKKKRNSNTNTTRENSETNFTTANPSANKMFVRVNNETSQDKTNLKKNSVCGVLQEGQLLIVRHPHICYPVEQKSKILEHKAMLTREKKQGLLELEMHYERSGIYDKIKRDNIFRNNDDKLFEKNDNKKTEPIRISFNPEPSGLNLNRRRSSSTDIVYSKRSIEKKNSYKQQKNSHISKNDQTYQTKDNLPNNSINNPNQYENEFQIVPNNTQNCSPVETNNM